MFAKKQILIFIVLLGGSAVLVSYAYGLKLNMGGTIPLWGGVPAWLLPYYQLNMLLAAAGFFAYTYFIIIHLDPAEARIAIRFHFSLFNILYVLILVPSALWLPLTVAMLKQPGTTLWVGICLVLDLVALASIGMLWALLSLNQRNPTWAYLAAVIGSIFFSVQTAILDAIVWTAFFPLP